MASANAETFETLDPDALQRFIDELIDAGFTPDATGRRFTGVLHPTLERFTDATTMAIIIRDPWPYRQPSVHVEGIDWWHAAHDYPCLWQPGDNTRRWVTLDGIRARLDEWANKALTDFAGAEGAALDPHLYFRGDPAGVVGIDVDGLVGGLRQDGQHGPIHFEDGPDTLPRLLPGRGDGMTLDGHWFYRAEIGSPPPDLAAFEATLTEKQRSRLDKVLTQRAGVFVLIWPTVHGLSCLAVRVDWDGERVARPFSLTPISQVERLRRAGPDAHALATRKVVQFGVGAIGSHLASLLGRSGLGHLTVVDGDLKVPAGVIRHASERVNISKVEDVKELLAPFEWTVVRPVRQMPWLPSELTELIQGADLCVDATGLTPFAELLSRVADAEGVPMVTVALYRGGRVARVRRQTYGDLRIVDRRGDWRYPEIPHGGDRTTDFLGAETGCAAVIHNAPPTSVMLASSIAAQVCIAALVGRATHGDETIHVIEPIEGPFDTTGTYRPTPPEVTISDVARGDMLDAAHQVQPNETGGILLGLVDDCGHPFVTQVVEFRPDEPSPHKFEVPANRTTAAVDAAQVDDPRLQYLGEWHSHPTDQPASPTDRTTMLALDQHPDTGTPVLLIARPRGQGRYTIDAHVVHDRRLHQVPLVESGPPEPYRAPASEDVL